VRWFLYKLDLQPFSTGTKVYTGKMSNWWYGIARSDWQQPQDWTEYAERADGTVYRTTTPAVHASMPGYGLSLPIKPLYSVRLYAWMQYEWLSASPTTKYPTQYAWAGGSCYWKFPWGSR